MNNYDPNYIAQREAELIEEMNLLSAKRLIKPSMAHSQRMNQIFAELYQLTGQDKYKL